MSRPTPTADSVPALLAEWRAKADVVRPFNAGAAHAFEECAAALEVQEAARARAALTIPEAARLSGYHPDTIRHKIAAGELVNIGRKHAPRVRAGDLPRKPKMQTATGYDPGADALSIAARATRAGGPVPNATPIRGYR